MTQPSFRTPDGGTVAAVTADEMWEVDRVAVEEVGLHLLQMMENAGRILAWHVRDLWDIHDDGDVRNGGDARDVREVRDGEETVVVVAGDGGNGGGGMACARHLANREVPVQVVLDRPPGELSGAAADQYRILAEMAVPIATGVEAIAQGGGRRVVVDSFIGYGLDGSVRPQAQEAIDAMNRRPGPTISLDVPSGIDATTGETLGVGVRPDRTVTLALPKTGLDAVEGAIYLADIGVPRTVYDRLSIDVDTPFGVRDWIELLS